MTIRIIGLILELFFKFLNISANVGGLLFIVLYVLAIIHGR
jgi:hypothetical protein